MLQTASEFGVHMYKDEKEFDVKRLWNIVAGIAGFCLVIFLMFGSIIKDIGLYNFALYAIGIVLAISHLTLWVGYKRLSASHNDLCTQFRDLRRQFEAMQKSSKAADK